MAAGLTGSVLAHWLVVVAWGSGAGEAPRPWELGTRQLSAALPLEVVRIRPPAPPDLVDPSPTTAAKASRPTPRIDPPRLAERRAVPASTAPVSTTAVASGAIAGLGASVLAGAGRGAGGEVDRPSVEEVFVAPRAKSVLHTWQAPRSLIGSEILVRVHTDATGRATGLIELLPPTGHEETDREIRHRALRLQYWPATVDGNPVDSWAEISFEFCFDGTTATSPPSPGFGVGEPCEDEPTDDGER